MFLALTTFSMLSEDNVRTQINHTQYQTEPIFKLEFKSPFNKIQKQVEPYVLRKSIVTSS